MLRMLWQRALVGVAVVTGVVTLTFLLLHAAPGDPAERLLGPAAAPQQVEAVRHALELDRPLTVQYASWLRRFVRGDWGTSITTGRPVGAMLRAAWPATARLVALSLLLSYALGLLSVATVTLFALPGFWLGLVLIMVFTYWLRVLPAFGAAGMDADFLSGWARIADQLRHLALPLLTLTLIGVGGTARFARGALLDVLAQPFVAAARAKGVSESRVLARHVLRNALGPMLILLGLSLPALFSGAVLVETVFAWPGVGRVMVEAVQSRDYPVVMAATAVSALLVVVGNILADVLAAWADPRVRGAAREA